LNQEFGWDRASISAAGGLAAISSAIAIPFVGWLIDRWGIRTILLPIVVLSAFSIALIALTPNSIVVFMLLFAVTGFLGSGRGRSVTRNASLPGSTIGAAWPWA
jgi:MFS family permease